MINKNILMSALTDKFNTLTLHSIVNECFVNGLPFNQDEISENEKIALTKYSYKVLNKVGGFGALESSIQSPTYSTKQKMLLSDIYTVCTEASKEAATRICNDTDCKDKTADFANIVDSASFTDAEYKKFVTKAESLDLDTISSIIKDKTLNVIKDEQEQYEKEEDLDNELKDALADSKDFSETTTEAYIDIVLTKADPRHHVSLFSRLQESAMEMMSTVKLGEDGTDVIPLIDKVTFESFIDGLKDDKTEIDKCYEAYVDRCNEEVCNVPDQAKPKFAMLVSIIVYSVIETLKTMNIYNPSPEEIRSFVCKAQDATKVDASNADTVISKAQEMLEDANVTDYTKANSELLSKTLVELKKISELLQMITVNNGAFLNSRTEILNGLQNQINNIESILNSRRELLNQKADESLSYYDKKNHINDVSQFNKIFHMYGNNPSVSEIRIKINPATEAYSVGSVVDVDCTDATGQVIKTSFMDMRTAVEGSKYVSYLQDIYKESKLADCNKKACILLTDGTGKKIAL